MDRGRGGGLFAEPSTGRLSLSARGGRPMISTDSYISKRPDRCGGDACVRDTRLPVWVLANFWRLGMSDADLLRAYPSLTPADIEVAREYVAAHPEEIDQAIREN